VSEIILHHYPQSPVSEKVRIALGIKGLAWRSVHIPRLPPKPDLMPLTGGYRQTPVMQIGAEVFCDRQCILANLERRFPEPTLLPGGDAGLAWGIARWTDGALFKDCIAVVFADAGDSLPADFAADRGRLYFGLDYDMARLQAALPDTLAALRAQFGWMEQHLASGRSYMAGPRPGLSDALCYYLVWFLRGRYSRGPAFLAQFPQLCAWETRVREIGHGSPSELSATHALEIARAAQPETPAAVDPDDPLGLVAGQALRVVPEGPGAAPEVAGRLRALDPWEVVLDREDPRVGTVAVHFPRVGYRILRD